MSDRGDSAFDGVKSINVCIADDISSNAKITQRKLQSKNVSLGIQLMAHAEDVVNSFQNFDLIIINNEFGPERMTGIEAIHSIRQQESQVPDAKAVIIALWSAGDGPGADLVWDKAIKPDKMWTELTPLLNL